MNYQAVIFDLDGTLLSWGYADEIWQPVCENFAPKLGLHQDQILSEIRGKRDWFWRNFRKYRGGHPGLRSTHMEIVSAALSTLGIEDRNMAKEMDQFYLSIRKRLVHLSTGATDTLIQLRSSGIRLGLITNGTKATQRSKIHQFGLTHLFDNILVEGEFGIGKPNPHVYQHVLNKLGVRPSKAWMVGDDLEWDVEAPQRIGIFSVWFDVVGSGLPKYCTITPDRVITSLRDLIEDQKSKVYEQPV